MLKKLLVSIFYFLLVFNLSANESHGEEKFDLAKVLVHHLMDSAVFPLNFGGEKVYEGDSKFNPDTRYIFEDHHASNKKFHYVGGLDMHITRRVTMMWIVSFFLLLTFISAARIISKNPTRIQSRFAGAVESVLQYLQTEVIDPNMHGHGHPFYHYLFSLFFFILFCNLFGLIPSIGEIITQFTGGGHESLAAQIWSGITVTGDVSVTASLALLTLILIWGVGFWYQGPLFFIYSVPDGVPYALYPLLLPMEFIISPVAKAFALTVRLLANMTAGHVIILALIGFIFQFQSVFVSVVSVPGAIAIYMLEIFVAFLQAFIFTLLTSLFVGSSMHRH